MDDRPLVDVIFGKSRASATTHRSEKTASTVKAEFVRQAILGGRSSMLARMEASSHRRHAGNGRPLAPGWFSFVLEDDLQSQEASWEKTNLEGGSRVDLPDGRREPDGERRASMANFSCWVLLFPRARLRAG